MLHGLRLLIVAMKELASWMSYPCAKLERRLRHLVLRHGLLHWQAAAAKRQHLVHVHRLQGGVRSGAAAQISVYREIVDCLRWSGCASPALW